MRPWLLIAVMLVLALCWLGLAGQSRPSDRELAPDVVASVALSPVAVGTPSVADSSVESSPVTPPPALQPTEPEILVVPYRVEVRTDDPLVANAALQIATTLEDPHGWQQANIDFQEDPSAAFVIVLVEGDDAQTLCQPYNVGGEFSCQNGPLVVLNAIRWRESVPHWPWDLDIYRTMLVNHEVGHLLGMHHLRCGGDGQVAPVMEQQSGSLRGCKANPWPTTVELTLAATHQFELAPGPSGDAPPR